MSVSWFDKLTMRERDDATLITEIAAQTVLNIAPLSVQNVAPFHHPSPSW
ncbi:hypothetical protein SAMN05443582_101663 [Phyllobacterium sp. OV277]|nr:hypothetical protein SAMN05443582_101663 [Phyllobacterium sp. OV277]